MSDFKDLGLQSNILQAIKRLQYEEPTPVQEQAIPLVLKKKDLIAAAQTGTGKTASFALPLMQLYGRTKQFSSPRILVVTPTRELAQQIGDVCITIARSTHHRITTVVGGLSYRPQIERLKRGCDLLIATPGRLIDLIDQQAVDLSRVQALVLDEADRMLDMGFLPSIKKIVSHVPKKRQTLLFSATIDSSIKQVAGSILHDPETVEIARKGDVASTIEHFAIRVPHLVKPELLLALLQERSFFRVIVFARTKRRADAVCRKLQRAGYKTETIHSDRSQAQRKRALDKFSNGQVNILVATDVLARGIDIDEIDFVVNYDVPDQAEDYIHRIGRTGRAGASGLAITFVTAETEKPLKDIERLLGASLPEMKVAAFDEETARALATEKSIRQGIRFDPDIQEAKRELAKRTRRKNNARKKAAAASQGNASRRGGAPKGASKGKKAGAASGATKRGFSEQGGSRSTRKQKRHASRGPATRDVRPGRARRAELLRRRNA